MFKGQKLRVDGWYVKKPFSHFDLPLDYQSAREKVADFKFVIERSFWPLIGFTDSKRKFKKEAGKPIVSSKDRSLRYCSHVDGYIHSYYALHLIPKYEDFVLKNGLNNIVIGYRKGRGNNVDMAKDAFDEIERRSSCIVIALDIKSFFDSIDHAILKQNLCEVLGETRLPRDWYQVFKSMTKFSWVELSALAERLGFDENNAPRPVCSSETYRKIVRGDDFKHLSLVNTNTAQFGIPQGSPLSAIFSNIYMAHFDISCAKQFEATNVFYRRYSDDIIIICEKDDAALSLDFVKNEISKLGPSLQINNDKTEISEFKQLASGVFECDKPVTYLGLTYDGKRTLLRGRTLSRYYRRMTYAARQTIRTANKSSSKKVFLRGIYRDFTHLGRRNFYTYAKKASLILNDDSAVRQLRRHFKILQRKLRSKGR